MDLPNFKQFEPFNNLRKRMGAGLGTFEIKSVSRSHFSKMERIELANKGLTIDSLNDVYPFEDGTLGYKDTRILLYINDVNHHFFDENDKNSWYKYHVSCCKTIEEMKNNGRYDRYVVSTRTDGKFQIGQKNSEYRELDVCKNCLLKLNFNGYESHKDSKKIFEQFTIKAFFESYPVSPFGSKSLPRYTDTTAPENRYSEDWKKVSEQNKQEYSYKCHKCDVDYSDRPEFLTTHHKNGRKEDNEQENLVVLCWKCHASEYKHEHMKQNPRYKELLKRKKQV